MIRTTRALSLSLSRSLSRSLSHTTSDTVVTFYSHHHHPPPFSLSLFRPLLLPLIYTGTSHKVDKAE